MCWGPPPVRRHPGVPSATEGLPYLHGLPYVCYRGTRSSVQLVYVTNAVATISNEVAFHAASDYSLEDCHINLGPRDRTFSGSSQSGTPAFLHLPLPGGGLMHIRRYFALSHACLHKRYKNQACTIHEEYKSHACTIRCVPATAKTLPLGGEISLN